MSTSPVHHGIPMYHHRSGALPSSPHTSEASHRPEAGYDARYPPHPYKRADAVRLDRASDGRVLGVLHLARVIGWPFLRTDRHVDESHRDAHHVKLFFIMIYFS